MADLLARRFAEWKERGAALGALSVRTARLMIGVPDYETYVRHRQTTHPGLPVMSYEEFFRERQAARYGFENGRFRGCC